MELLRYLNSPEYRAAQEQLWQRVRGSYEVRGCLRPFELRGNRQAAPAPLRAAAATAATLVAAAVASAAATLLPLSLLLLLLLLVRRVPCDMDAPARPAPTRLALPAAPAQVLDAVPWVAPRPLFLLATEQRGGAPSAAAAAAAAARYGGDASPGQTYTLRTRVARAEASDELSMVLKKRAQDGSALIRCSEMKVGGAARVGGVRRGLASAAAAAAARRAGGRLWRLAGFAGAPRSWPGSGRPG